MEITSSTPKVGMRVIYGRTGFKRSGFKGVVVGVTNTVFKVEWDELKEDPTTYTVQAWAKSRFRGEMRDRDKHYIFFNENSAINMDYFPETCKKLTSASFKSDYGRINTNPCSEIYLSPKQPTILGTEKEEETMKKTMVKQTIINGVVIQEATEDTLIRLICELEGRVAKLKAIKVDSTKIKTMIGEHKLAIKEVVTELDSRV